MTVERFFNVSVIYTKENQNCTESIKLRAADKDTADWIARNTVLAKNKNNVSIIKSFVNEITLSDSDNAFILNVFNRDYVDFLELISKYSSLEGFLELYSTFHCRNFKVFGCMASFEMDFLNFTAEIVYCDDKVKVNTDCITYLAPSGVKFIIRDNWCKFYYG